MIGGKIVVQLGNGMSDKEIIERLVMTVASGLRGPIHWIPEPKILPEDCFWQKRGVLWPIGIQQ